MPRGYVHMLRETDVAGNELNTPATSTKELYLPAISSGPDLEPTPLNRDDEIRNSDEPVSELEEKHAPKHEHEVRGYPDVLGMVLSMLFGPPASTAGDGIITDPGAGVIPVGATRHVWDSSLAPGVDGAFSPFAARPQTSQMQWAYSDLPTATYFKQKGAAIDKLTIETPDTGGMRLKFGGPGLYLARGADPALTPAYESLAIRPFTRRDLTLPEWLSGTAVHEDFSIDIANGVEPVHSMGISSKFPDVMDKAEGPVVVSGSLAQRYLDPDDYDALKSATAFSALAQWVSESIIASGYPYKFFVNFEQAQYTAGSFDRLQNKRRHAGQFTFKGVVTTPGTPSVKITLVNATPSYA